MADNNTTPTKSFSWVIYVLKNPRTLEIRYVGWTRKKPGDRLKTHVWDSVRHPHQTYRQAWIMSLVSIGLTPIIEVIESGTGEGWGEAERKWIARYRAQGARLVNGTDGGDGVPGWGTPEQRSAIRKAVHAQRTPEERSEWARKIWAGMSPEARKARLDKFHAVMTPDEHRAVIEKWQAGRTHEQRSAELRARHASKSPEERSAILRKGRASMTTGQKEAWIRSIQLSRTHEQKSTDAKANYAKRDPAEKASERLRAASAMKEWQAKRTPEQRREAALLGVTARAAKHNSQRSGQSQPITQ